MFVDFGLYDLRKTNGVKSGEYAGYARCWFDYLSPEQERIVRSLPAGGHEGKTSEYCR